MLAVTSDKTFVVGPWVSRAELPGILETARELYRDMSSRHKNKVEGSNPPEKEQAMPATTSKSELIGKLGKKLIEAHAQHKDDETSYGFGGELPAGITGGVAQVVLCKFDKYKEGEKKGEYYFMAQAVVVSPAEFEGMKIAGERTRIGPEPLCDTPNAAGKRKTLSDHYGWVLNELRKLGVDTGDPNLVNNLEAVAAAVEKASPFIKFRTWKGQPSKDFPDPRTNHEWGGLTEYSAPASPTAAVEESNGAPGRATATRTLPPKTQARVSAPPPKTSAKKAPPVAPEPEDEAPASNVDLNDIDSLVERAEGGDTDARTALTEMAIAAGASEEQVEMAANWTEVAELISGAGETEESEAGETEGGVAEEVAEETSGDPEEGQMCRYQPIDPATKKPAVNPRTKKPVIIEAKIVAVNSEAQKADIKSVTDGKTTYRNVPWARLIFGE